MKTVKGRASAAMAQALVENGSRVVFGNPGTMELPLYDELGQHGIELVLALQEIVAVGVASGYAAMARTPGVVIMHTPAGLGNGMGALYDAQLMELPLVVIVGLQDTRHQLEHPVLAGDGVQMAQSVSKWVHQVRGPEEVAVAVTRAFAEASRPPRGIATIAVAMDHLLCEGEYEVTGQSPLHLDATAEGLEEMTTALLEADNPLIVSGTEVGWYRAEGQVAALAEAVGAAVMSEPVNSRADFDSTHPLYRGVLPGHAGAIAKVLARHDVVLVIGSPVFRPILYNESYPIPEPTRILHLDNRIGMPARRYPVAIGAIGGLRASVTRMTELVQARDGRRVTPAPAAVMKPPRGNVEAAFAAIATSYGDQLVVVDEASSSSWFARLRFSRTDDNYLACNSGGLGQGPGFAVGAAIGSPGRTVLALLGDGGILYAPQALWTAANREDNVIFLVICNDGYQSIRNGYQSFDSRAAEAGVFPDTRLHPPHIDYLALAATYGVPAATAQSPEEVVAAVGDALARTGPSLIQYHAESP